MRIQDLPNVFRCIIIKLNAKDKKGQIFNCKTLIANIDPCCLSACQDRLVLTIHLFIAAIKLLL